MTTREFKERAKRHTIEYLAPSVIILDPNNARKHTTKQISQLKAGISTFGFVVPILVDEDNNLIAGHARLEVAIAVGMSAVPAIRLHGLAPQQRAALAIAENRHGDNSSFDRTLLAKNLKSILDVEVEYDFAALGFDHGEVDVLLDFGVVNLDDEDNATGATAPAGPAVTVRGEVWLLAPSRLMCGDALDPADCEKLLGGEKAQMVITDPPYNIKIDGFVSGNGKTKHREFAMASGEMSSPDFTKFLSTGFSNLVRFSNDGSIHYVFMDWRHMLEMLEAGNKNYSELKALCVWNKTNAGLGSLYRSQHELVFVWKNGTAKHINNIQLSRHGRFRSNVWAAAGANSFRAGRDADLAAHSTVKSVELYTEAMRDCSARGGLVLDIFAGSGTVLLAADRTGRRAAAMEIDPLYVDTAARRWQSATGKVAVLEGDGRTFAEIEAERLGASPATDTSNGEVVR